MFFKYLGRELSKRRKQTTLIASGLAVAIALVVAVAGVSSGIKTAQAQALSGLYGIGTDISISKTEVFDPTKMGQQFKVGAAAGSQNDQKRTFSKSRLEVQRGSSTLTAAQVAKVAAAEGVSASVATLKLNSVTFSGELPVFQQGGQGTQSGQAGQNGQADQGAWTPNQSGSTGTSSGSSATNSGSTSTSNAPTGGSDGKGGSSFSLDSFSVEGIATTAETKVGPLASTTVTKGRSFSAADAAANVVVLDSAYAKSASLKVDSTVTIADTKFKVIGIVASASASATTPSNAYIPIEVAQKLSGETGAFTNIYVSAKSSATIDATKAALKKALPGATVSTQSDLASNVSGSLATASSLINDMGGWLSFIVLLAAFGTSILFTTSGVNRRVREFGTLKAIGWRSRRVVGQVVGESLVTGLFGGVLGLGLGAAAIFAINSFGPTVSASISRGGMFGGGQGGTQGGMPGGGSAGGAGMGGPGGMASQSQNAVNLALHATLEPWVIAAALGFAILGGLLAGAFGGLRAAKLSPAQALRSLA